MVSSVSLTQLLSHSVHEEVEGNLMKNIPQLFSEKKNQYILLTCQDEFDKHESMSGLTIFTYFLINKKFIIFIHKNQSVYRYNRRLLCYNLYV